MDKRRLGILLATVSVLAVTCLGQPSRSLEAYGRLPLRFENNDSQSGGYTKFVARGGRYTLFLASSEAILTLKGASIHMKLAGSNPAAPASLVDELPGTVNYFIGNDPRKWRSNVRSFAKARYQDVYPGVDLVYYGNQRQLEYDFLVAPGADPGKIALTLRGAERTRIDRQGDLVLRVPDGEVRFHKPVVYQQDPERTPVSGRYVLRGNRVGFALGAYDRSKALVIDPAVTYATYLGGTLDFFGQPAETDGFGIAVDPSGNVYITGSTDAVQGFPVVNAYQATPPTPNFSLCPALVPGNVFVAKLSPTGTPVYVTYLGGTHCNQGIAVAADASGNASVTGFTESPDFPVTPGAFQTTKPIAGFGMAAFLTKFSPTGGLAYSTFLAAGRPGSVAVDGGGNVYLTGQTDATLSPKTTAGAYRTTCASSDTYVMKFSSANALQYASCLGSNSGGGEIAVDPSGNLYILGGVGSPTDFLVKNGFQASVAGRSDAFLAKLKPAGAGLSDLLYATFFGGSGDEEPNGLAADSVGNVYIAGSTGSSDLPVTSASFKSTCLPQTIGACTGFVARFNTLAAGAASRVFATYLGGSSGDDAAQGVAVDTAGNGYVTGYTASSNFPTVNPIYGCPGCGPALNESMFVTEFNPAGSILFSTFLGGSATDSDEAFSIALDPFGAIYLTGIAGSQNLPPASPIPACLNPVQSTLVGFFDAFVVKLSGGAGSILATSTAVTSSANPSILGQSVTFTATVSSTAGACAASSTGTVTFRDGATILAAPPLTNGVAAFTTSGLSVGNHSITASYGGDSNFTGSTSAPLNQKVLIAPVAVILVNEVIHVSDVPASQVALLIAVAEAIHVTNGDTVSNTPTGSNVVVKPVDTTSGSAPVTLTFGAVTQSGNTSLTTGTGGPPPPSGFQLGSPPEYYNLTTTASFTGAIQICINYTGISFVTPPGPRLFHVENGSWVDRTVSVDTTNKIVCGSVTALSPFALFRAVSTSPPTTSAALSPLPNATGWNNSNVTVTLTSVASPGGSPVKQITYRASGAQTIPSTVVKGASASFPISPEGVTTITFFGTDNAGNIETPKSVTVKIDKTPPTLACAPSPVPNAHAWNNTNVTMSFKATDATSGLASVSPALVLTSEGANQVVNGTAVDNAGNKSVVACHVNIDKTPPEAFGQFDAATKGLLVFGRDSLSGVAPGPVKPEDDQNSDKNNNGQGDGKARRRTYKILDLAGNVLVLVETIGNQEEHDLKAGVVSLQYANGPVILAPVNEERFEWDADDGRLKELEQTVQIGSGANRQDTEAKFESEKNQTIIEVHEPKPEKKVTKPGLVLLRTTTDKGKLGIEF